VIAEYLQIPFVSGAGELSIFLASVGASCLGFLWFNAYPAEVFMGDVGALALGAALGVSAVITKNEFLLLPTDQKEKVIAGVKEFKPLSESEFRAIWDKVLTPVNVADVLENIISNIPDEYKPVWNSLNENEKTRLLNQSALYNLNSTYAIKNFWYTRKELNEAKELQLLYPTTPSADKLNESATTKTQVDPYMEYISNALSR
jgi:hypothetical protein